VIQMMMCSVNAQIVNPKHLFGFCNHLISKFSSASRALLDLCSGWPVLNLTDREQTIRTFAGERKSVWWEHSDITFYISYLTVDPIDAKSFTFVKHQR
jgi:hypothetical protein